MKRLTATLRERQAEAACLCPAICLTCGARRRPKRGRQVATNLPACREFGESRKELGYGE